MTPAWIYALTLIFAVLFLIVLFVHITHIRHYFTYEFRNVMLAAFCPFIIMLIVILLLEFPEREAFSFSALIMDLPADFANLSIAFIAVLGAAMAVSNVELIRREGMAISNTLGTALQLVWILATLIVYALVCVMRERAADTSGVLRYLCNFVPYFLYCLIDYGECMMIGIMIMGWVAAHGKSVYDKDFIIIPGCSIRKDGGLLPLLRGRVNRAVRYAWEQERATGKPVRFIPSGGQGPDEIMSEGSAMELYLLSHSAEDYEVLPEKESANTEENFLFSARIIKQHNPDAKVAFATTNYHVLRCGMLAKKAGLKAEGLASSTKWYFWPNGFAREVIAIVNMTLKYHLVAAALILAASALITYFCC